MTTSTVTAPTRVGLAARLPARPPLMRSLPSRNCSSIEASCMVTASPSAPAARERSARRGFRVLLIGGIGLLGRVGGLGGRGLGRLLVLGVELGDDLLDGGQRLLGGRWARGPGARRRGRPCSSSSSSSWSTSWRPCEEEGLAPSETTLSHVQAVAAQAERPLEVPELVVAVDVADRVVDEVHQVLEAAGVVEGAEQGGEVSGRGAGLLGEVSGLDDDRVGGDQLRPGGLGGVAEAGRERGRRRGGRRAGSGWPC